MPSKTRNRHDLIRFLNRCDQEIPVVEGQQIVAVSDNLSTRRTEEVQEWLQEHPRWRFQFTPTHASWLNQVEIYVRHEAPCERRVKTKNISQPGVGRKARADAAARRTCSRVRARWRIASSHCGGTVTGFSCPASKSRASSSASLRSVLLLSGSCGLDGDVRLVRLVLGSATG